MHVVIKVFSTSHFSILIVEVKSLNNFTINKIYVYFNTQITTNDGKISVNIKCRILYIVQKQSQFYILLKLNISPSKIISLIHEILHLPRTLSILVSLLISPFINAIVQSSFISWMSVKCLISSCYTNVLCSNPGTASGLLWSTRRQRNCDREISAGYAFIVLRPRCEWKTLERTQRTPIFIIKQGLNYYYRWYNHDFDATDARK